MHDLFTICSRLVQNFFAIFYNCPWNVKDLFTLFYNFFTSCSRLFSNRSWFFHFSNTLSWLVNYVFMLHSRLVCNLFMTCSKLVHKFFTTCSWLVFHIFCICWVEFSVIFVLVHPPTYHSPTGLIAEIELQLQFQPQLLLQYKLSVLA